MHLFQFQECHSITTFFCYSTHTNKCGWNKLYNLPQAPNWRNLHLYSLNLLILLLPPYFFHSLRFSKFHIASTMQHARIAGEVMIGFLPYFDGLELITDARVDTDSHKSHFHRDFLLDWDGGPWKSSVTFWLNTTLSLQHNWDKRLKRKIITQWKLIQNCIRELILT